MHRFRRHRRLALLPAIMWLLAQFLMTGIMPMPAAAKAVSGSAAATAGSGGLGLSTVVICTPAGLEVIALDAGHRAPPDGGDGSDCRWCQAFGTAPELPPPADAVPVWLDCKTIKFRIEAAATLARLGVSTGFQSRAPPL